MPLPRRTRSPSPAGRSVASRSRPRWPPEPSVLILDEPTFGQDRRTAVELLDLLAGLRDDGAAICFVTHDAPFAEALADRTIRLTGESGAQAA